MSLTRTVPLQRKTRLKSKRATPRHVPELTCAIGRCNLAPKVFQWCKRHAIKEADRLFSLYIRARDGKCLVCGLSEALLRGDLQCMHGVSRAKFATRWDPQNAFTGCSRCHYAMTNDPNRWDLWCTGRLGPEIWGALKFKAERGGMPDVGWVITELRQRLKGMAA